MGLETEGVASSAYSLLSGLWSFHFFAPLPTSNVAGSRMRCAWPRRTTTAPVTQPRTVLPRVGVHRALVPLGLECAATLSTCAALTPWRTAPTLSTPQRRSPCATSWSQGSTMIFVRFDLNWTYLKLLDQTRRSQKIFSKNEMIKNSVLGRVCRWVLPCDRWKCSASHLRGERSFRSRSGIA